MVTAPVINSAVRNDSMVASVTFFVSPSLQNSDYFEIKYYEMTGPANAGADTMASVILHEYGYLTGVGNQDFGSK